MKVLGSLVLAGLALLASVVVHADPPATHGMLLFGDQITYVSHLPMFHAPHDWQAVFKVSLQAPKASVALEKYAAAKGAGATFFTLVPEPMDLAQVIEGGAVSFHADLYLGHFEKGGQMLGGVQVTVEKVIYARKLDPQAAPDAQEKYLVFGEPRNYFAAHLIGAKPSFDMVAKVGAPYELKVVTCRSRVCPDPVMTPIQVELPVTLVKAAVEHPAAPGLLAGDTLGDWDGVLVDVLQPLYFEQADLQ
jgi:hypothetical protein